MTIEEARKEFEDLLRQAADFHGKPISKEWEDIIWDNFYASQFEESKE